MHERQTKLEDTLEKFMQALMTNQKNIEASIRNLETQVGQLETHMVDQNSDSRQFSANTQTNTKEHCKAITIRGGKVISPDFGKNLTVEKEVLNNEKSVGEKEDSGENKDKEIYQSCDSRLSEGFSPQRERLTWEGEILGYTGGFSLERELGRLSESGLP
ncbi:hypothetical protein Lal_00041546 [Lupinus albus]|nr:hypothetical protein Lal_00041546 [Lupinus albus]